MTSTPHRPPPTPPVPPAGLGPFNAAPEHSAAAALHRVCASTTWCERVLAGRPYPDPEALLAAGDTALAALTPDDLAEAVAGHPPIGRPEAGDPLSSREQRGMDGADDALRAEMHRLNLAYERRFGHVLLICATGLTAGQLRDRARLRLGNPPEREREAIRAELGGINRIRLARLAADI
ncbi:2-oxo-4-hydroxy-4-carboxy-5-ureidoimidazoline decarboxylase [Streptomyces sp. NPDC001985]|uniref:2-oxo-4-hydroxy-4-carboxy-5-ureidoimidazoline decarboxylase n=1 Tax=Streptomyces sp. NPDC001985 TaxID=3154406 RepID=UPI003321D0F6